MKRNDINLVTNAKIVNLIIKIVRTLHIYRLLTTIITIFMQLLFIPPKNMYINVIFIILRLSQYFLKKKK